MSINFYPIAHLNLLWSYHNAVVKRIATKSTRKQDMIDWLAKHRILHEPKMLKFELFDLIKRSNPISVYQTDVLAAKFGYDCLRLPVEHCELNPIKLVWAQVKRHTAHHNTGIAGFMNGKHQAPV